eukprot:11617229-Ditylum_brightwellii.AAC.2
MRHGFITQAVTLSLWTILEVIDPPAIRAFTSKCGYNRNMAYTIRDGPSHLGGSELTPLNHLQTPNACFGSLLYGCSTNWGGTNNSLKILPLLSPMLKPVGFRHSADI